jgi:hypothetical protein
MKTLYPIAIGFALLAVVPVVLGQDLAEDADNSAARVCFNSRAVNNFDAFTDQHVYVREGSSRHFLLTMRNRCPNLRNANGIALKDTTSRICSDGFGEIVYRDRMSRMGLQTCRIGTIEVVESKDDAKAIVESRKAAKKAE